LPGEKCEKIGCEESDINQGRAESEKRAKRKKRAFFSGGGVFFSLPARRFFGGLERLAP
jgi:hypothetical protein